MTIGLLAPMRFLRGAIKEALVSQDIIADPHFAIVDEFIPEICPGGQFQFLEVKNAFNRWGEMKRVEVLTDAGSRKVNRHDKSGEKVVQGRTQGIWRHIPTESQLRFFHGGQ